MNIIYFTMKNLNENRAFLAMLGFLFIFSCKNKDNGNGNGGGNGDTTKYTLTITKPTNGTLTSDAGGISCGSKGTVCKAEFSKDSKVTLTAKADTDKGYILGDWQGACDKTKATESTCKLSMDANKTAGRAFLARPTLSIDPKPIYGTLSSDVGDINCGSEGDDCEAEFDKVVEVTLTAKAETGYALAAWQGACDKTAADQPCKLSMDADRSAGKFFIDPDVDDDDNGLMEIRDLDMFNHIQYDLAGTSYKMGADAEANTRGAPTSPTAYCTRGTNGLYLCGYELMRDLDFAQDSSYAAGSTKKNDWQPNESDTSMATNEGFVGATNFAGIFEGNGHSISNLYSRGDGHRGLFRVTTSRASIRNLGVVNANIYGSAASQNLGALVGSNHGGSIIAGFATGGTVNGGDGIDSVGGLVGSSGGSIVASYATGAINGGAGNDYIGGLLGYNDEGDITASYATGATNGDAGNDTVGGLLGGNEGTVIASYATGATNGNADVDNIGGLVGYSEGSIVASYATGDVDGGVGADRVGGLVGIIVSTTIVASYATGATSNGTHAGDLTGTERGVSTITKSYGFGSGTKAGDGKDGDAHPSGVTDATDLTSGSSGTGAGSEWDDASEKTKGAWDFGTTSQNPALKYTDYDEAGTDFSCATFPPKIPGTNDALACGTTLLPGQGR